MGFLGVMGFAVPGPISTDWLHNTQLGVPLFNVNDETKTAIRRSPEAKPDLILLGILEQGVTEVVGSFCRGQANIRKRRRDGSGSAASSWGRSIVVCPHGGIWGM